MNKVFKTVLSMVLFCGLALALSKPPIITSISPVQGIIQDNGEIISVLGTNFKKGEQVGLCIMCVDQRVRDTQFISSTQLLVRLLPGDLSQQTFWSIFVFNGPANTSSILYFPWAVTDGTINISPGDVNIGLNGQIQFSATSTISGDTIQWSLYNPYSTFPYPPPTIDSTGLFTAPPSFNFGPPEYMGVIATSTADPTKYTLVMVNIQ